MKLQYGGDRRLRGRYVALLAALGVAALALIGRLSFQPLPAPSVAPGPPPATAPPATTHPALGTTVGIGPGMDGVAAGAGGVWVTCWDCGEVVRVDPVRRVVVARIPVTEPPHGPISVAVGFGAAWVTSRSDHRLLRIDTASNRVVARIPVGPAFDVATGAGSVWVMSGAVDGGDAKLVRVDPRTGREVARIPLPGSRHLTGMVVQQGAVWFGDSGGSLWRVDAASNRAARLDGIRLRRQPHQVVGETIAGGDLVWVLSDRELIGLDPEDGRVVRRRPWSSPGTSGFPIGAGTAIGGALWLESADGLARYDPRRDEVTAVIPTGDVEGLTAGDNLLWATQGSHLIAIDPLRTPSSIAIAPGIAPPGARRTATRPARP